MQNPIEDIDLNSSQEDSSREGIFLRLLSSSYNDIYYSVLAIVGNRTETEDVIQDVCILLWQKFDDFDTETDFRKWACAFAFNLSKAYVRKQRRRRGFGLSDDILGTISRMQSAGGELFELRRELLQNCLKKLSRKDQQFLLECHGRRSSPVKFAQRERIPVATAYTRLSRLRKVLHDCISRAMKGE